MIVKENYHGGLQIAILSLDHKQRQVSKNQKWVQSLFALLYY